MELTDGEKFEMSINGTINCNFESILDMTFNKFDYSRSAELNRLSDLSPEEQSILLLEIKFN